MFYAPCPARRGTGSGTRSASRLWIQYWLLGLLASKVGFHGIITKKETPCVKFKTLGDPLRYSAPSSVKKTSLQKMPCIQCAGHLAGSRRPLRNTGLAGDERPPLLDCSGGYVADGRRPPYITQRLGGGRSCLQFVDLVLPSVLQKSTVPQQLKDICIQIPFGPPIYIYIYV